MNKRDKIMINEARLELLHWIQDDKGKCLQYSNKAHICDKVNSVFMPLMGYELPKSHKGGK